MKGISLSSKSKGSAFKPQAATAKKSAFGGGDSDEDEAPVPSTSKKGSGRGQPAVRPQQFLSRAQKQQIAAAESQDASVFAYDEVFDSMKSAQQAARDKAKEQAQDREPRYVEQLLKTAEQRKLDRVKAEDVMTAREREKEGDEFKDKESFVTPAYLAQQEEIRQAEEAEKAKGSSAKGGMAKFYEQYLSSSADAHQAASEAAKKQQSGTGTQPEQHYDDEPVSDMHLAREAASRLNRVVQVNEDGQVVDKTELLSGGLNMAPPRKPQGPPRPGQSEVGGFAIPIAERARREREEKLAREKEAKVEEEPHWSGRDRRELEKERRQRQSAAVEKQIVDMRKRQAEEAQLEHDTQVKKVAKRNDSSKIEALKRAAAERRKAKAEHEQEQAAQ